MLVLTCIAIDPAQRFDFQGPAEKSLLKHTPLLFIVDPETNAYRGECILKCILA